LFKIDEIFLDNFPRLDKCQARYRFKVNEIRGLCEVQAIITNIAALHLRPLPVKQELRDGLPGSASCFDTLSSFCLPMANNARSLRRAKSPQRERESEFSRYRFPVEFVNRVA